MHIPRLAMKWQNCSLEISCTIPKRHLWRKRRQCWHRRRKRRTYIVYCNQMTSMKTILKLLATAFTNFNLLYDFDYCWTLNFWSKTFISPQHNKYHQNSRFLKIAPTDVNVMVDVFQFLITQIFLLRGKLNNGKVKIRVLSLIKTGLNHSCSMQYDAADKKMDQEDPFFIYLRGNWPWNVESIKCLE